MCGAITSTVRWRPISRNSASSVASNWRMAEPNWKPCVHSVQPWLVYRPPTVKTGAPLAGAQDSDREFGIVRGIELENGGAELEALRPLGPALAGIPAADSENGRSVGGRPGFLDGADFGVGQSEHPAHFGF